MSLEELGREIAKEKKRLETVNETAEANGAEGWKNDNKSNLG